MILSIEGWPTKTKEAPPHENVIVKGLKYSLHFIATYSCWVVFVRINNNAYFFPVNNSQLQRFGKIYFCWLILANILSFSYILQPIFIFSQSSNSRRHLANAVTIADVKSKIIVSRWHFFANVIYSAT